MEKHEQGFVWGVLTGVTAVAVAGALFLTRYFKITKTSQGTWQARPKARSKPKAVKGGSAPAKKR